MQMDKPVIVRKKRQMYEDFIAKDRAWNRQRCALINLRDLQTVYRSAKVLDTLPDSSNKTSLFGFLRGSDVFGYHLHLIKLAILDARQFKFNLEAKTCCFNRMNVVFLFAMIRNRPEIVGSMLRNGFPSSINSPIFGSPMFPTYFQLACAMHQSILSLFLGFSPNYALCWNGLTPQMIASFDNKSLETKQAFSFVTMKQYQLLGEFRGLEIVGDNNKPLFLIDFLCMQDDLSSVKKLLDRNPELARTSKLCYLMQNNIEWILLLTRYQTDALQDFGGFTPLHLSCLNGSFEELVAFLCLGLQVNAKDRMGNTPMHYCALLGHSKCLELLARLGGNISMVNRDGLSTEDILERQRISICINETDSSLEDALVDMFGDSMETKRCLSIVEQIKYNCSHVILKKSRFTITSLLNLPHKIDHTETQVRAVSGCAFKCKRCTPMESFGLFEEYIE